MTATESVITPLQAWMLCFDASALSQLESLCLHCFAQRADPQTGEVELSVAKIHKLVRTSMAPGNSHAQRHLVGDAVDSLAAKGILQTIRPGVMAEPGKPGVCAKRRIVI